MGAPTDDNAHFLSLSRMSERANTPRFTSFGSTSSTGRAPTGLRVWKHAPSKEPRPPSAMSAISRAPEAAPPLAPRPESARADVRPAAPAAQPLAPRPPFFSSSVRPPFTAASAARRRPRETPADPDSLGSAHGSLAWYAARLEEDRRTFQKRLAAAEARHEASQRQVQALKLRLRDSPRTLTEESRQEEAYEKEKAAQGREASERWRVLHELRRERDAALAAAVEAGKDSERRLHESVLLRGEVARLKAMLRKAGGEAKADGEVKAESERPECATDLEKEERVNVSEWLSAQRVKHARHGRGVPCAA